MRYSFGARNNKGPHCLHPVFGGPRTRGRTNTSREIFAVVRTCVSVVIRNWTSIVEQLYCKTSIEDFYGRGVKVGSSSRLNSTTFSYLAFSFTNKTTLISPTKQKLGAAIGLP